MSYSKILKESINGKHYSYAYISEQCLKLGIKIDPSYISKIVNGKVIPPSDEISIALAKTLEINPRKLILESAFEKQPQEFKDFLEYLKTRYVDNIIHEFDTFSYKNEKEKKDTLSRVKNKWDNFLMSDFILDEEVLYTVENYNYIYNYTDTTFEHHMNDNSMYPIIKANDTVIVDKEYKKYSNGDIVAYMCKGQPIIRKYTVHKTNIILTSANIEFEPIIMEKQNFKPIGKVIRTIQNF